jgi:DUF4097 and DUF4098 domain-containing protein YvlB
VSEEKLRILKMLEEGKITAQEAENLLRALGETLEEEFGPRQSASQMCSRLSAP